jgi:hypothetical protein
MDAALLAENEQGTARLKALVERLTDTDLARNLGDGWNPAVALAHLGFWDERAARLLEHYAEGTPSHQLPGWYDDLLNETLEPEWRLLPARQAAQLAVAAAEHVTRAIGAVSDDLQQALEARDEGYLLRRFNHRREHIEQIESSLG